MTLWAVSAVQEQSWREQAAQQAAQAAQQQADHAGAAVQSRERALQDLLQEAQRECGEYKHAADQAAEELSQEQHKRQRVQEDLKVSWRCNGLPLGLGAAADWDGRLHVEDRVLSQIGGTSQGDLRSARLPERVWAAVHSAVLCGGPREGRRVRGFCSNPAFAGLQVSSRSDSAEAHCWP